MSRHEIHHAPKEPPTQQVLDEAQKVIGILDSNGQNTATQVRELLLKDFHSMSAKDSKDLLMTVMNKESKYQGYDLEIFGHSRSEVDAFNAQTDKERANLGRMLQKAPDQERKAEFAEFNEEHQKALERYKSEMVVEIAKERAVTDAEKKQGIGIVTIGDPIRVATFQTTCNGLPDFKIVDK